MARSAGAAVFRVILALGLVQALGISARADELPPELAGIVRASSADAKATATNDVLALNRAMFELYGDTGEKLRANILALHPVILGLFSGGGGRFILYRPGQAPLEAPPVPIAYQLMKSVGHSTMALTEVVLPYLTSPGNQAWRASLAAYRTRMQSALDALGATDMPSDWRENSRSILKNNIEFMDARLQSGSVTLADLEAFAKLQAPLLRKNIAWAAQTQVHHWMEVLAGWKAMLGPQWNDVYAASNTIYVARQNNVLFSVLAQFFPPDAINSRLMLIETTSFTTTPEDMLEGMTRIISDRSVGALFFHNYYLMDYELMGGDARQAIIEDSRKRGMTLNLPPAVPFGSHQWPTLITPGDGPTSLADLP
jgi:hypothetical protein